MDISENNRCELCGGQTTTTEVTVSGDRISILQECEPCFNILYSALQAIINCALIEVVHKDGEEYYKITPETKARLARIKGGES